MIQFALIPGVCARFAPLPELPNPETLSSRIPAPLAHALARYAKGVRR